MVHTSCKETISRKCSLGQWRISILPPISINNLDSDGFWEASKPLGVSPLLVFINSKSGDNQGVKMYRRFKQMLNPAQVFDLINGGPRMGLRLFQKFDLFRILVCGGDGSIGWVLCEIDKMELHKQCQIGVLPLGTGNDLARVLGWGAAFDDDTQLPMVLERLEHAQIKMLDRWSVMTYEGSMPPPRKLSNHDFDTIAQIATYEDSVTDHLTKILQCDDHSTVISSAKVLCETVKDFVAKVGSDANDGEDKDSISSKCAVLNQKLDALLKTLDDESQATTSENDIANRNVEDHAGKVLAIEEPDTLPEGMPSKPLRKPLFKPRDALMSRANSLKKAVRQIIEHTEKAVDEQNEQTLQQQHRAMSDSNLLDHTTTVAAEVQIVTTKPSPTKEDGDLPSEFVQEDKDQDQEKNHTRSKAEDHPAGHLGVPGYPLYASDGESSGCVTPVTPRSISPMPGRSPEPVRADRGAAAPQKHFPEASRRISSMSTLSKLMSLVSAANRDKSPSKEIGPGLPMFTAPNFPRLPSMFCVLLLLFLSTSSLQSL